MLPTTTDLFKNADDWTSAGLVFTDIGGPTFRDLWITPIAGGAPRRLIRDRFSEYGGEVSPDGRWIAYLSNEAGVDDVYLQSFPAPGHKTRVSTGGANRVWWMPGSDELCYRTLNGPLMGARLTRQGDEIEVAEPRLVLRFPTGGSGPTRPTMGGGCSSACRAPASSAAARVILDWTALVKR